MTALERRIRARIARDGPISVEHYMALCLGDPDHGYYMSRDPFGRAGDFITAPEVSQMFGELIGVWCVDIWRKLAMPDPVRLIEAGPGRGTLMADLMRAARKVSPEFAAAGDVHMVETSPALRKVQQTTLANQRIAANWHDAIERTPAGSSIVIANEFLDALPVRQYVMTADGWRIRGIDTGPDDALRFTALAGPVDIHSIPGPASGADRGAIRELCPAAETVIAALAGRFGDAPGIALIVDYGPARSGLGDTLQALRDHRPARVLEQPGEADLTAHVDFEHLAGVARNHALDVHGPMPQGVFLNALGLAARAKALARNAGRDGRRDITDAVERLAGPHQMGQHFKVMIVGTQGGPVPEPFASMR